MSLNVSNTLNMTSFKDTLVGHDANAKTSFLCELENIYSGNSEASSNNANDDNSGYLQYFNDIQCDAINEKNEKTNVRLPGNTTSSYLSKLSDEEERKLVLESVKDVNCDDFPFEEVLSLEDTVNKANAFQPMSGQSVNSYNVSPNITPCNNKRGGRPPLLKCQTWSHSEFPSDVSKYENKSKDKPSLDSPSFYNTSSIDFSAISHLSEEHDKIMAQEKLLNENNKNSQNNPTSQTVPKDKPQRRTAKVSKYCTEAFKSTHKIFDLSQLNLPTQKTQVPKSGRSFSLSSEIDKYTPSQTFSKEDYSVRSHPNESTNQISNLSKRPQNSNTLLQSNLRSSKNLLQMTMEKQPLPPEGFKITRYPLQTNMVQSSKSLFHEVDTLDKNSCSQSDLLQIILKLRKRLEWTEDKLQKAENDVQEYKEIAMKTINASRAIRSQMKKPKKSTNMYNALPPNNSLSSQTTIRRWSDDAISTVSNHLSPSTLLKRVICDENKQSSDICASKRRKTIEHVDMTVTNVHQHAGTVQNLKNKGLLDWLSAATNDTEDMEMMNLLQNSSENSQVVINDIQKTFTKTRSMSHDAVRIALRAKVGGRKPPTAEKIISGKAKLDNIQETCDFNQQTLREIFPTEFPSLSNNNDGLFCNSESQCGSERLYKPNTPTEIFHSLSDSELHNAWKTDKNANTSIHHISSESLPNISCFKDLENSKKSNQNKDSDFFSQLDNILEL